MGNTSEGKLTGEEVKGKLRDFVSDGQDLTIELRLSDGAGEQAFALSHGIACLVQERGRTLLVGAGFIVSGNLSVTAHEYEKCVRKDGRLVRERLLCTTVGPATLQIRVEV